MQGIKSWICLAALSVSALSLNVVQAKKVMSPPAISINGVKVESAGATVVLTPAQLAERDRMSGKRDESLIGKWVGDVPAQASCSAYAWRTERGADGTYRLHYFDEAQTLLDDKGYWWVDGTGRYHEFSTDTQEEAVVYTYNVAGQQATFRNVDSTDGGGCEVAEFAEKKIS